MFKRFNPIEKKFIMDMARDYCDKKQSHTYRTLAKKYGISKSRVGSIFNEDLPIISKFMSLRVQKRIAINVENHRNAFKLKYRTPKVREKNETK